MAQMMAWNTPAAAARAALGAMALALSAAPASADVKAGVDAWSAGDFTRAVVEWQAPAAAGDADALFNLAQAYRLGRGVEIDSARARKLYEEAANLGHVKAADNYGLMLFQEGERQKAMPMIRAAADRGDPRAQYVLGLSHFNADYAPRDWVRAYALMTLANGAGLPQAADALAQMDKFVPAAQRSQAQSLALELEAEARSQRTAELTAVELALRPEAVAALSQPTAQPAPKPAATAPATVAPRPAQIAAPRNGNWRVQLGAFGVAGNAERLWNKLSGHEVLAGTQKTLVPSGGLTRLLATGFATEAEATRACAALKRQGQACMVVGQS